MAKQRYFTSYGSLDASHMPTNADPTAPAEIVTATVVAPLLRMTPAWVYAETRRNRIPHMRLGRYFRYRRSTIEAWMSELERDADDGSVVRSPRFHSGGAEPAADRRRP